MAMHGNRGGVLRIEKRPPAKVLITVGTGGDEEVPPNPPSFGSSSIIMVVAHATHAARTENRGISISFESASDRIFVGGFWILDSRLPGFLNK